MKYCVLTISMCNTIVLSFFKQDMNVYKIGTSTISLCEFFLLRIIPLAGSAVSRSVKLTLEDLAKQVFGISYRSNVIWQVLT